MSVASEIAKSIDALRKWQRHHLLRQFGDNGLVLPDNLALSKHLDTVLGAAEMIAKPTGKR